MVDQSKAQTGERGLILEPLIIANATGITLATNGLGCPFFLVLLLRAAVCRRPRFFQRARSGAGRLTREASHDAPTIYKRRKMKSGHYFERFFCGRWKWLITKLMRCNFFDYFSKSAGIFGSKAGEIHFV